MAFATYDDYPAAGMAIKLASGANAIATQKAVLERVEELKPSFPEGMEVVIPFDTTPFISAALKGVIKTLF